MAILVMSSLVSTKGTVRFLVINNANETEDGQKRAQGLNAMPALSFSVFPPDYFKRWKCAAGTAA